jgi:hypothetical protein
MLFIFAILGRPAIRLAFAIIHSYASLPVSPRSLDNYRICTDRNRQTSRLEHSPGIMCVLQLLLAELGLNLWGRTCRCLYTYVLHNPCTGSLYPTPLQGGRRSYPNSRRTFASQHAKGRLCRYRAGRFQAAICSSPTAVSERA